MQLYVGQGILSVHATWKLQTAEEVTLLFITKACKTASTSTAALNVITGIPPIELTLLREAKCQSIVRLREIDIIKEM